jgi:cation:H+ antiporter
VINFSTLPLQSLVILFVAAAIVVWIAGSRLALCGDELAERFKLTREFVGLILLATVTEFPEIVTTITAARVDNAALVLGNMFGGITMQTAILAVVDVFVVHRALTSWPRKPTQTLVAAMLIVLLSLLLAVTIFGDRELAWNIGVGAVILSCAYPVVIALLRSFDEKQSWAPIDYPDESENYVGRRPPTNKLEDLSSRTLIVRTVLLSAIILVSGIVLAMSADGIANVSSLGSSFVGTSMLAAATSLPELSTTIAAARIGAYTMAIANIFGSNLIMLALILPADIAYRDGTILAEADRSAQFILAVGIIVTAIYVVGLLVRRTPAFLGAGADSWTVAAIYLGSLFALYAMQ